MERLSRLFILFLILGISSCSKDIKEPIKDQDDFSQFAITLSKAIYNEQALREIIREESLKKFDNDYDVLYWNIRNRTIGNKRVEDLILQYDNTPGELIKTIERHPLLTIFVADWKFINSICAESWDVNDPKVLVASGAETKKHTLWGNGEIITVLSPDEFPPLVTLIVKDNERVRVSPSTKSGSFSFDFIDPCYDPSNNSSATKLDWVPRGEQEVQTIQEDDFLSPEEVGEPSITAYNLFHNNSAAKHRDFIYYGMTGPNQEREVNNNISEVLYQIRFSNAAANALYDDITPGYEDPKLSNDWIVSMDRRLSSAELISRYWVDGQLELRFQLFSVTKNGTIALIEKTHSVYFYDLFYLKKAYTDIKHETLFNWNTDYKYHITRACFEPKWYKINIPLIADWNIGETNTNLKIRVFEMDNETSSYSDNITINGQFAMNFREYGENSASINAKIEDLVSITGTKKMGFEYGGTAQQTVTGTKSITVKEGPDLLGEAYLYYHQPIILEERDNGGTTDYRVNVLSTGTLQMMIIPKTL